MKQLQIVIVDNEPERHDLLKSALRGLAEVATLDPSDVTIADLDSADLISVDEYLGQEWALDLASGAFGETSSVRNYDGLAVAAAFRSYARTFNRSFAVSLHTGRLDLLGKGLSARTREPLVAAQHDLDWVFEFDASSLGHRLLELAQGLQSVMNSSVAIQGDFGTSWLQVPDLPWAVDARSQLESCRPPAHELTESSNGRNYLRWIAQRILPYPAVLLDIHHAANLLGLTVAGFEMLLEEHAETFAPIAYVGPLSKFLGPRWWRAGLQSLLSTSGAVEWDSAPDRAAALNLLLSSSATPLASDQPVVTYNSEGMVASIDQEASACVRLQIDGWPLFADDPWATKSDVGEDPDLLSLVSHADRSRLSEQLS